MGNYFKKILILQFFLLFASCSIDNADERSFNKYNGTWLWLRTEGGLFPRVILPEAGQTLKISFDSFGFFRIIRNDSLKVIARYKIEEAENDHDKIYYYNIISNNYEFNTVYSYSKIHLDTLGIWDGAFDGFFSFYKKID